MKKIIKPLFIFIFILPIPIKSMQSETVQFLFNKVLPGGSLFAGTTIQAAHRKNEYKKKQDQFQHKLQESERILNTLFFIVKNNPRTKDLEPFVHQLPPHEQIILRRLGCKSSAFNSRMDYYHAKREVYSSAIDVLRYEIRMSTLMSWVPVAAAMIEKSIR